MRKMLSKLKYLKEMADKSKNNLKAYVQPLKIKLKK